MDSTSKATVHRRSSPQGAFFGGTTGLAPLQQHGEHDPAVKQTWDQFRTQQSTSEQFNEQQYGQSGIQKVRAYIEQADRTMQQYAKQTRVGQVVRQTAIPAAQTVRNKTKPSVAAKVWTRARVSAANVWIVAWIMFWYFLIQLPFAVISSAGFGMAAFIIAYIEKIKENSEFGRWFVEGFTALANVMYKTFEDATIGLFQYFFKIGFDPILLFIIPFALVLSLGLMQLLLSWFVYSVAGVKSLSGRAAAAKQLAFLFGGLGMVIPFLNLFPLILIWTIIVWFQPK